MYELNVQYYKELTMYIIAGKKALGHAKKTKLIELKSKAEPVSYTHLTLPTNREV